MALESAGPSTGCRAFGRWVRFQHLGIRQRIMLYVTLGLVLMFGSFALLGLQSIEQATQLVYEERLTRAYTLASMFESDFRHVAADVQEERAGLLADEPGRRQATARALLLHLANTDPFHFFHVTGLWLLAPDGAVMAAAGRPAAEPNAAQGAITAAAAGLGEGDFALLPAADGGPGDVPFATLALRLGEPASPTSRLVAVHLASEVGVSPEAPSLNPSSGARQPLLPPQLADPAARYHLEVLGPDGHVVLGLGGEEEPTGSISHHFRVIQGLGGQQQAATLLHRPGPGEDFEPHVMAVVPLGSSRFSLVLEQAVDVALALPMQVEQRLVLLTTAGFLATLAVAWVTTGRVVKPTQELTGAAQGMARGDLESPIHIRAQDEVGQLAESLETMRQQLRTAYRQLEDTNRALESQVRERTARLGELLQKVISAQEEERARLARELHDETAQTLGALTIALDRARDSLDGTLPQTAEQLAEAKAIAARLLEETRRLILDLRPMALDDLGLAPAIRWYVETHLEDRGVAATVEVEQPAARLPKHLEVSLFRIIQEAVTNIAKRANASHAHIRLTFRGAVAHVLVSDDGQGFAVDRVLGPGLPVQHVGLLGMQERVGLLNGRLEIHSEPGRGTAVSVEIPIVEEAS